MLSTRSTLPLAVALLAALASGCNRSGQRLADLRTENAMAALTAIRQRAVAESLRAIQPLDQRAVIMEDSARSNETAAKALALAVQQAIADSVLAAR